MIGMLCRKIGMSHLIQEDGEYIPVTLLEAGPCVVTQIKAEAKEGYNAVQLAAFDKKPTIRDKKDKKKRFSKPASGHYTKANTNPKKLVGEYRLDNVTEYELGQVITVDQVFKLGDRIDAQGKSRGKGFAGTIKRWGFGRGPVSHGSKNIREPGSIGACTWPAEVIKGKKLPGRMGGKKVSVQNLKVVEIDAEKNLLVVKGGVPGAPGTYINVKHSATKLWK